MNTDINKIEETNGVNPSLICLCPVCKSPNVLDNSLMEKNGIYGPGSASWKINDTRVCNDCGIMFVPVKGNGLIDHLNQFAYEQEVKKFHKPPVSGRSGQVCDFIDFLKKKGTDDAIEIIEWWVDEWKKSQTCH